MQQHVDFYTIYFFDKTNNAAQWIDFFRKQLNIMIKNQGRYDTNCILTIIAVPSRCLEKHHRHLSKLTCILCGVLNSTKKFKRLLTYIFSGTSVQVARQMLNLKSCKSYAHLQWNEYFKQAEHFFGTSLFIVIFSVLHFFGDKEFLPIVDKKFCHSNLLCGTNAPNQSLLHQIMKKLTSKNSRDFLNIF